mgnify:CR=1 FL=1|jgi:HPt (histidine-containing phosphotransfer) domain-containing protein
MAQILDKKEIEQFINDIGIDDFKILLDAFFSECSDKLADLDRNSLEADHDLLELNSHTLKSLSRTFGALKLGEACAKLEHASKNKDHENYRLLIENIKRASHYALEALRKEYS